MAGATKILDLPVCMIEDILDVLNGRVERVARPGRYIVHKDHESVIVNDFENNSILIVT